jgi:aspartyl-tRNA(Asn)/glutamyl-tRNA(Gln) amidotransferase subunit B
VPLVEIVSEPDLATPAAAADYLQTLHQLLLYTGSSDANLEEGSLRCDANVSLRRRGESALGTKAEVKNLNSFRNLARALEYEIQRQREVLAGGGRVVQETRGFDAERGVTRAQRSKEEAHDYRYFPEPDLPPLVVDAERGAALRAGLPEVPWERRRRFREELGLAPEEARELTAAPALAEYFEAAVAAGGGPKPVANWVMGEVRRELRARRVEVDAAPPPARLARLVGLVEAGALSTSAAKEVFAAIWESGEEPVAAVERLGLGLVRDEAALRAWVEAVLAEFPAQVEQLRAGKTQVEGFLVGQVMKRSAGRAEPRRAQELVRSLAALPNLAPPRP